MVHGRPRVNSFENSQVIQKCFKKYETTCNRFSSISLCLKNELKTFPPKEIHEKGGPDLR